MHLQDLGGVTSYPLPILSAGWKSLVFPSKNWLEDGSVIRSFHPQKNKSWLCLCNPRNLQCNLHLARTRNPSNYTQPASEESWGSCCAQPAFQAKLTGGICRKLCRRGQIVDISPSRPINLCRNLRAPRPQPWGSPSHVSNDGIIPIPEVKKTTPARNSVWPCVFSSCTGGCTSAFLMSDLTTSRKFLSPGGIQSIDTVGFLQRCETLTTSSPPPKLLTCHLGAKLVYTNQNLSNEMFSQPGYFWFTPP